MQIKFNNLRIALKNFLSTKNILKMGISFILAIIIRSYFKSLDVNLVFFENDTVFCLSTFFSISLCSLVRKYLDVIDIPNIKFSLVIDFLKST
jgi:hypothetical protein